jgi:hypothetical protein
LTPVQVTCWTTALSPLPVFRTMRCQPGLGTNESIAKPLGTVSHDLRRGRVVLLGRDCEAVQLELSGERDVRADLGVC